MKNKTHQPNFYNTINLKGSQLSDSIVKANSQDAKVLQLFRQNPNFKLTKYEIWELLISFGLINSRTPTSSIGRAMNTLYLNGQIVKLNEMKPERYGKPNHLWQLSDFEPQTPLDSENLPLLNTQLRKKRLDLIETID